MGIDSFLLASSLRCVVGQRLLRVLCDHCKHPSSEGLSLGGGHACDTDQKHWSAAGCDRCFGTGYCGRIVISEVLSVDDEIRQLIQPNAQMALIEAAARKKGMTTMIMDGVTKCLSGVTTQEEVRRVALDI
jgi:general secretion pathway protein E